MVAINKIKIFSIFLSVFIIYFLLSIPYYSGDVKNFPAWVDSLSLGLNGFYERQVPGFNTPNYPPLTIYLFALSEQIYNASTGLIFSLNSLISVFPSKIVYLIEWENVYYSFFKLPTILANLALGMGIYKILSLYKINSSKKTIAVFIFIFNPTTIYVSAMWGQIDFLPLVFVIFALFSYFKSMPYVASILIVLSLMTKQTAIIFLPVFLYLFHIKYGWMVLAKSILLMTVMFFISLAPFSTLSLISPFQLYISSFDSVAKTVGENVFNFWGAIFNFTNPSDQTKFLLLNFRQWGILLFGLTMIYPTILLFKKDKNIKNILIYLLILSLVYFFFITRLHERHLAPAIAFLSILVVLEKKFVLPLILISSLYMINLYNGFFEPNIEIFNWAVNTPILIQTFVVIYFGIIIYTTFLFKKQKMG